MSIPNSNYGIKVTNLVSFCAEIGAIRISVSPAAVSESWMKMMVLNWKALYTRDRNITTK
jgi:hypothetical protein